MYLRVALIAVFECKLTLRRQDIKRAFEVAYAIKRKAKRRQGSPYDELNNPPLVGLLAHSQSLGKGRPSWKLHEAVEGFQDRFADHFCELLDIICVAESATLPLAKSVLVGENLDKEEIEELTRMKLRGAIAAMYVIHDESIPDPKVDFTGAILAGLIHELTYRLAFEDASIRPWADHLSNLGFYGDIGRPIYCSQEALSSAVRRRLRTRRRENDRWSKWNKHLP
jgi:hypothetical protein